MLCYACVYIYCATCIKRFSFKYGCIVGGSNIKLCNSTRLMYVPVRFNNLFVSIYLFIVYIWAYGVDGCMVWTGVWCGRACGVDGRVV